MKASDLSRGKAVEGGMGADEIVEEEKNYIYNKPEFSISFFRDILQISSFSLLPNSIVFEMDKH